MTLKLMDNVLIVVEDLEAAKAFFVVLGWSMRTCTGSATFAVLRASSVRLPSNFDNAYLHGRNDNRTCLAASETREGMRSLR
jgi:hypothetical protein